MKKKTAEIANEIRTQVFFRSFSEDLLLELCTMIHEVSFKKGEVLIQEGQKNSKLFFLRQGNVEVSFEGDILSDNSEAGEVFGEMSAINAGLSSITVKALTDSSFFAIHTDEFLNLKPRKKEHFQAILLQEYCFILANRLERTQEKAHLFEVLNKELHDAQKTLINVHGGRVLLIEPVKKQQLPVRMALGGTGIHLDVATEVEVAKRYLEENKYDLVLSSETGVELLKEVQEKNLARFAVLLTSKNVQSILKVLEKNRFINHVISRDAEDSYGTIKYVLTSLSKLINNNLSGIERYLSKGVQVQSHVVMKSSQRESLRSEMHEYLKRMGVRTSIVDRVTLVAEEMLMNAIYDAPVDSEGKSIYNHLSRKVEVTLKPGQYGKLSYCVDGGLIVVSIVDPFGALTKDIIIDYLLTCYRGQGGSLNSQKGGGGLGLHQTIENSDLTVFNIRKGVQSEVICMFSTDGKRRESLPSFHYFFT